MVTLEIGQRIQQSNTTIWEIVELGMRDRYSNEQLWRLRMIEDPRGLRLLGEEVQVSASWLNLHCIDVNTTVEPPKGNGLQYVRILDGEQLIKHAAFATAAEMIAWLDDELYPEQHGEWFAIDPHEGDFEPDMTVLSVDGELVWSE